jgi:hypothetical protein
MRVRWKGKMWMMNSTAVVLEARSHIYIPISRDLYTNMQ